MARALRFPSGLDTTYWGDYVLNSVYIMNILPSFVLNNKSSYEVLHHDLPDYDDLKAFGCLAFDANTSANTDKLHARGIACVFLGYPPFQKGYIFLDINTKSTFVSRVYLNPLPIAMPSNGTLDFDFSASKSGIAEHTGDNDLDETNFQSDFDNVTHDSHDTIDNVNDFQSTTYSVPETGSSIDKINDPRSMLSENFHMKDLGEISYLGLEVHRSSGGFFLSQKMYVLNLFKKYHMNFVTSSKLPMETHCQGILLASKSAAQLTAYCDSDWASCAFTRRSTSGFFIMLGNSHLSWKIKKQIVVAKSSAQAKYRAMTLTSCEITWLSALLKDMSLTDLPSTILCVKNKQF
ncbi:hypothetical protein AgCh_036443 [Apium graveolens]